MRNSLIMTCFLCLAAFTQVSAQRSIQGKVEEAATGESLPYATVVIEGTSRGTTTNVDGFFTLLNVEEQTVKLLITYIGFEPLEVVVPEEYNGELLQIKMQPLSSELQEVIVTADAYKVLNATSGVSKSTISTKQLSLLPNIGETDIFRSLQLLPGVSGTNENSSGLFVRGGTPDQNLVLLDGMTIYKVDHFFGFFSAFNANAVKDVQLYKGAFPSKYGGRTSSVVDMTGKTGSFQKFGAGLNLNFLSVNGYAEVPLSDKFSVMLAGRRSYTDILRSGVFQSIQDNLIGQDNLANTNIDPANVTQVQPDFYFYDWNAKLSYKPSVNDIVTFSLFNGRDFLDESRVVDQDNGPVNILADLGEQTDWGNRGTSLKWSRQWNPKFYSNILVAGSEYFSNYDRLLDLEVTAIEEDTTVFALNQRTLEDNSVVDLSIRGDFEWQLSDKASIDFGFSWTDTQVDYSSIRNDTTVILERDQEAVFGSFYVSHKRRIGEKLSLEAGLRVSDYEFSDELLYEPRFNATYQFNPQLKLKGAYGRHYQFVNQIINENISEGSREFWLLADGDLVDVSSAEHYVLGVSYELNNWLFDMEGYYKDLSGLSEFSLRFRRGIEIEAEELFFTGDGIAKGIEFLVQKKQGRYTGWISYTLGRIRNTFPGFNEGREFPALHDQLHEFKMVHSYESGPWKLSGTFTYGSGKPFSEPEGRYVIELLDGREFNYIGVGDKNGSRLPVYHRLDLSAHYQFEAGKLKYDIGLSIFNFLGRQNVWYVEYDFSRDPVLVSEINYLGFTPNLSFGVKF